MKGYMQLLSLLIFIVSIWTLNTFFVARLESDISKLNDSKKELALRQSFSNQMSLDRLSKDIQSFVPLELNKGEITNSVAKLAQDASVQITKFDLQEDRAVASSGSDVDIDNPAETSNLDSQTEEIQFTKFKSVSIAIDFEGDKAAIDSFLYKLVTSELYIEIINYNIDFKSQKTIMNGEIGATILARSYYMKN
jgi:hypothetical protein